MAARAVMMLDNNTSNLSLHTGIGFKYTAIIMIKTQQQITFFLSRFFQNAKFSTSFWYKSILVEFINLIRFFNFKEVLHNNQSDIHSR